MKSNYKSIGKRALACFLAFLLSFLGITWPEKEVKAETETTYTDITLPGDPWAGDTNVMMDGYCSMYIPTNETIPGTDWKIIFENVNVLVNDTITPSVINVKKGGANLIHLEICADGLKAKDTQEVGTKITIKAGSYKGRLFADATGAGDYTGTGIAIAKDYAMTWNGSAWIKTEVTTYTSITFPGDPWAGDWTNMQDGYCSMYIPTNETLPGTDWQIIFENVNVLVNNTITPSVINVKKGGANLIHLEICADGLKAKDTQEVGTKITIKEGSYKGQLFSDATGVGDYTGTGITIAEDYAMAWNGSAWAKTDVTTYTNITLTELWPSNQTTTGDIWGLYINTAETLPGEDWKTVFENVEIKVNDTTQVSDVILKRAGANTLHLSMVANDSELPISPAVGTKITVKAGSYKGQVWDDATGAGNYTGTGIAITADYTIEWNGSLWSKYVAYTEFVVEAMQASTSKQATSWHAYFTPSVALPGEAWGIVGDVVEAFPVEITINDGASVAVTAKKGGDDAMFLEIPYEYIPIDGNVKVTIKAGAYKSNAQDIGYKITEDYTFYANEWGWSENDYLQATEVSPEFRFHSDNGNNNQNGFVVSTMSDDGTYYDATNEWSDESRLYSISSTQNKVVNGTLFFAQSINGGIYENDVYSGEISLKKMTDKNYYISLAEIGKQETAGTAGTNKYQIKGYFYDKNHKIVYYETGYLKWDGSAWVVSSVNLADTSIEADVNSDTYMDSRDLVRLIRHQKNEMIAINETKEDINYDDSKDIQDVDALRKVLLGAIYYKGDGNMPSVPYGTPIIDQSKTIEKIAYSCPEVGTWAGERYASEFTPFSDEEVDALFEEYKSVGFTLLNSEYVAKLTIYEVYSEYNEPLRTYLNGAARNGLGVIVQSDYLETILKADDLDGTYSNWKEQMSFYVDYLDDYQAFRGFMMSDELQMKYASNYQVIAGYLHETYPELLLFSSQLPNHAQGDKYDLNYSDQTNYEAYIEAFGPVSGHFIYDTYQMYYFEARGLWPDEYVVESAWYTNLKWVAEKSIDSEGTQRFQPGITIQTMSMPAGDGASLYAPEKDADIGFQLYTSMAWGMKMFGYFSYCDHFEETAVTDEIMENANVKAAVTNVNAEIKKFESVYQGFAWKQTLDLEDTTNASTGNERLESATVSGARTFIGCMKDVDGFDGYMIANAGATREGSTAELTLTFKEAATAIVYVNGEAQTVTLNNGSYTFEVAWGEGIFVIPVRGEE